MSENEMSECKTTVMLVDDHPLLRKGLRQLLSFEPEFEIIAEAGSGAEALTIVSETEPDLIILDLNMQGMDGLETLKDFVTRASPHELSC